MNVERLAHVAQHLKQRHVGHRSARRTGEYNIGVRKPKSIRFRQHRLCRIRNWNHVRLAPLHVIGWNSPQTAFKIKFGPCRQPDFLAADACKNKQFEGHPPKGWLAPQSGYEGGQSNIGHCFAILSRFYLPG
ncbi:hypothetical protein BSY18_4086 (plasmid) [Blastomonas sp. RAC04]|nr:hypothetical protein BSY18_4086 [Blastomonas sp. RAC04]